MVEGLRIDKGTGDTGDTGRARWLIWSVLALCYVTVFFHRVGPGVVADRLMADFSATGAQIGVLASIYFYVYAAMQIPSGALADTFGVRSTVAAAAALSGIGSLVFALSPSLELAYFSRLLVGLGVSVIFVAAMKFQANWFRASEFGTVSGLLLVVGNMGSITAATPLAVAAQSLGWRAPFAAVGVAGCAMAVAAWLFVRDRPLGSGLPAFQSIEIRSGAKATAKGASVRRTFLADAMTVWRNKQTWAGFLTNFGILGTTLTFSGLWAVPYLMNVYGMGRSEAANHIVVFSLGGIVSSLLVSRASDQLFRRRKPLILCLSMVSCAFWLTLTLWDGGRPPSWALYPLFAALGAVSCIVVLVLAAVKEANPPSTSGLAMGTANSSFLCAAILQPVVGLVLDSNWQGVMEFGARVYPLTGYRVALIILTGFALIGFLGGLLLKETYCRNVSEETT